MAQVIIYQNENGGVSVTYPTPDYLSSNSIEDVLAKDCPDHAIIVDSSSLPTNDYDYFDAWKLVNGSVVVDLATAKNLTKIRLRYERESLLQAQDVAFQRALEAGSPTTAIVAEKQRLRDLPALTDICTTLDQLRALKA
jgi:hypothetical protein